MKRALLVVLVVLAFAVVLASIFGATATPRVERSEAVGVRGPAPGTRKPRVRTVQPRAAPDVLRDTPLDVAEEGPCSLFLVLTDEATGAAINSAVELYRLDIPENEYWSRGDRLQAEVLVSTEGAWVRELPAARYRAVVHEQRLGSDAPVAFGVEGDETRVSLRVPMPQEFQAHLVVRDAQGERVLGGEVWGGAPRWHGRKVTPDWLTLRTLRRPDLYHPVSLRGGGSAGGTRTSHRVRGETPSGIQLLPWRQSSKSRQCFRWWGWSKDDWSGVSLRIDHDRPGDRRYAGASRQRGPIVDSIRMPDGTRAIDAGAEIAMASYPIEVTAETPADAWRGCTINVQVKLEGYAPLSFDLGLDEKPIVRTLVAAGGKK